MKPSHFYVVFNPLFSKNTVYPTQAHEFYQVLRDRLMKKEGKSLYWGKLRVNDYSDKLPYDHFFQALKENATLNSETRIFITDYHNLWVGKVKSVTTEHPGELNTLTFYQDKKVEMWFEIEDFDIISNDHLETVKRLALLHVDSSFYHYKLKELGPMSPGLRFPMIVQDHVTEPLFPEKGLLLKKDNPLLKNTGASMHSQTFVNPEANFRALPEPVKAMILNAELLLLEASSAGRNRAKLEEAIHTYLKSLELLLNLTFIRHLRVEEGHRLFVTREKPHKLLRSPLDKDKSSIMRLCDLKDSLDLTQIKMLLDAPGFFHSTSLDYVFRNRKKFWEYCRMEMRHTIKNEALLEIKAQLSKGEKVAAHDRELMLVRNILLGVGGSGLFNAIIESYMADDVFKEAVA